MPPACPRAADSPAGFADRIAAPSSFTVCLSLRPHFGTAPLGAERTLDLAAGVLKSGRVETFHLSHQPPGAGDPGTLELAREILRLGAVPLISVSLANRSRGEALEILAAYVAAGVRQLIIVTGDFPMRGPAAGGRPFFDLDSLQLLMLLAAGGLGLPAEAFARGCVVSPFKTTEAELVCQYARLVSKVEAGAQYVVAQSGFDPRRWDELARFCRLQGVTAPLLGSVLLPAAGTLRLIRAGGIPGVVLPAALDAAIAREQESPDGGTAAGRRRAAGSLAVLRGLGYRGALLAAGGLNAAALDLLLDEAAALSGRWRACVEPAAVETDGFHHFVPGSRGELNDDRPAALAPRRRRHPLYVLSFAIDFAAFGSLLPSFRLLAAVCRFCDRGPARRRALRVAEYLSKGPLYGCRMCGDCTLYACGFLCAEADCPKRMINGPCGGSRDGWCEVHPGRKTCFWVRVYGRLKGLDERPGLPAPPIPAKDRGLQGTCSWINFCLGRDHRREWVRRRLAGS